MDMVKKHSLSAAEVIKYPVVMDMVEKHSLSAAEGIQSALVMETVEKHSLSTAEPNKSFVVKDTVEKHNLSAAEGTKSLLVRDTVETPSLTTAEVIKCPLVKDTVAKHRLSAAEGNTSPMVKYSSGNYFHFQHNVILARVMFNSRSRKRGETINEFITAVSSLAEHCHFGSLKDEFIRDRIVVGIRNKAIAEQLVYRIDLTLEETLDIVRMFEARSVQNELLHKATNAWKPHKISVAKGELEEEESETEYLYRRVRGILNKLTPQKFVTLLEQVAELPIDTESRLKGIIDLVFEKAVDEPNFSVPYANMCKHLMKKAVPSDADETSNVNFRKLLLTKCQREFERDIKDEINRDNRIKQIEESSDDEKKKMKEELEEEERKLRRRCLGNIRFIGELYNLGMLTANIMHDCLNKLLKQGDEDSLQCLCLLMITIGKELDETANQNEKNQHKQMDVYFKNMQVIVDSRNTSSRVRFMLQDVMDLRLRNWEGKMEVFKPTTIEQIHIEASRKAEIQQISTRITQQPLKSRSDDDQDWRKKPKSHRRK